MRLWNILTRTRRFKILKDPFSYRSWGTSLESGIVQDIKLLLARSFNILVKEIDCNKPPRQGGLKSMRKKLKWNINILDKEVEYNKPSCQGGLL